MLRFPGTCVLQPRLCVNTYQEVQNLNTKLSKKNEELKEEGKPPLTEKTWFLGEPSTEEEIKRYMSSFSFALSVRDAIRHLPVNGLTYIQALKFAEVEVLPLKLTSQNLLSTIKKINAVVEPEEKGNYRQKSAIILNDPRKSNEGNAEVLRRFDRIYQRPENKSEYVTWKTSMRLKVWNAYYTDKQRQTLKVETDDEIACFKKIGVFTIPASQIPEGMEAIKDVLNSSNDCYEVAGNLHQLIVDVHPFLDGNGRTARIMMNVVLLQAGKDAIIFDCEEDYTKALKGNDFNGYIKRLSTNQPVCHKVVEMALRYLFESTK